MAIRPSESMLAARSRTSSWSMRTPARVQTAKSSTTPGDPIAGVIAAIRQTEVADSDIGMLIHGTTVATNALLEHKGARTGFVCTKGFRDIIFIQRMNRKHHYDLTWDKPKLPVNRRDCLEVTERVDYMGRVLAPLDEAEARAVAREMAARGLRPSLSAFCSPLCIPRMSCRCAKFLPKNIPPPKSPCRMKCSHAGASTSARARPFSMPF